ncbi:MAG TPA: type IV pilus secretin PilQ [Pyrinomonadaceae bacterium]|jgi:type IV pilus assembly protein PilQ
MTFLQKLSSFGTRAALALMVIGVFTLAVSAQRVGTPRQGTDYGKPGFIGEPINLNVVNADIRDILNYVTEQYGVNFVIDKSVKNVPVTVNVSDVPWNIALDSILQSQDLGVQVNGPILRVAERQTLANEQAVANKIRESQLDSSPLYTEFIRLNYACAGACASQTSFQGGTSSGGGGGAGGVDQGILGVVKKRLSRRGAVEVDNRSNTLIITDVRENIDAIRQLILLLDNPEPQVEIEARIVIASRNFSRDLGAQLSAVLLGRGGSGGGFSTLPLEPPAEGGGTGTQNGGLLQVPGNVNPNGSLQSQLANSVLGLTTGIFGTAQINLLITAGENKGQAKTIATPRVTTLNNRKAEIESGTQIPIVTTQPGTAGTAVALTTEYVSVPLRLEVTPQITDVGTVVLDIVAENNSVGRLIGVGGTPAINTQRMKTYVTVPDGGTTIVGGALLDAEGEDQFRTPGLSQVPILGNLFKRKAVSRTTNEILFFITPRIYRPDFNGNQIPSKVSDGTRTTTILQPVPLGNPQSNSSPTTNTMQQQQPIVPLVPVAEPSPNNPSRP